MGSSLLGLLEGRIQQWSHPANPMATSAQRVALLLALQPQSKNKARHISSLGSGKAISGISDIGVSVVAGGSFAPKNLWKVAHSMVSACHGSCILLALDRHVRNHVLAERFGAPPNGPVWTSVPFHCR